MRTAHTATDATERQTSGRAERQSDTTHLCAAGVNTIHCARVLGVNLAVLTWELCAKACGDAGGWAYMGVGGDSKVAVGETVILQQHPLRLGGFLIGMERERQQNDRTLANGYSKVPQ